MHNAIFFNCHFPRLHARRQTSEYHTACFAGWVERGKRQTIMECWLTYNLKMEALWFSETTSPPMLHLRRWVATWRKKRRNKDVNAEQFIMYVRFEVFTAVTMKNAVFWDVTPCISCVNRRFGGKYRLHLQGRKIRQQGTIVSWWLQTAPGFTLADFSTLKIEAIRSSETSVDARSTRRLNPEDGILRSHSEIKRNANAPSQSMWCS
jgi:hypothetical protein